MTPASGLRIATPKTIAWAGVEGAVHGDEGSIRDIVANPPPCAPRVVPPEVVQEGHEKEGGRVRVDRWSFAIVLQELGYELRRKRNECDDQEQERIDERKRSVDAPHQRDAVVMVDPDDPDDQEAGEIGEVRGPDIEKRRAEVIARINADFEDWERRGDREDAVAKSLEPPVSMSTPTYPSKACVLYGPSGRDSEGAVTARPEVGENALIVHRKVCWPRPTRVGMAGSGARFAVVGRE